MDTLTVIYRTGGTENFKWHKVFTLFPKPDAAIETAEQIRKMGYPTMIFETKKLESIGMPETY